MYTNANAYILIYIHMHMYAYSISTTFMVLNKNITQHIHKQIYNHHIMGSPTEPHLSVMRATFCGSFSKTS